MEKISEAELLDLLGGMTEAYSSCEDIQREDNVHGKEWTDAQWDAWCDQYDKFC